MRVYLLLIIIFISGCTRNVNDYKEKRAKVLEYSMKNHVSCESSFFLSLNDPSGVPDTGIVPEIVNGVEQDVQIVRYVTYECSDGKKFYTKYES